jgi:GT2 family glycosyltransferase
MSFSIIIPSKTATNLAPCIRAVRAAGETSRIIVVDDGIEPGVHRDYAHSQATVIEGPKPFIFSRNCNLGIEAAGDDDVILLNDDALLKNSGGFTKLAEYSRENPDYGCIGAVTNLTGQFLQQPRGIGLREVPHIAFVCVYIPRETIRRIGLLDERYCIDYGVEDRDYCEAITREGLKVGVLDYCFVDHASLTSTFRGHPESPRSFAQNYALFKQKWGMV